MALVPWPFDYGSCSFHFSSARSERTSPRLPSQRCHFTLVAERPVYREYSSRVVDPCAPHRRERIRTHSLTFDPGRAVGFRNVCLSSTILFGTSAGTLTVALDAAVISFWSFKRGQSLYKVVFNLCALPLTIWLAAKLFFSVATFGPLFRNPQLIELNQLRPLVLATVVYFLLSSWIITFAIALEQRLPAFRIWTDNFTWISLNYFGGASVAALLVSYTNDINYSFLIIIVLVLPLFGIIYATYSRRVGRVQDANRHLSELNALYVSTIETLAMAIDAKDQVTHGHIRRVQLYAVALAKHLV